MKKGSRNKKQASSKISNATKQKKKKETRKFQKLGYHYFITDFKNLPHWAQALFVVEVLIVQLVLIVSLVLLIL